MLRKRNSKRPESKRFFKIRRPVSVAWHLSQALGGVKLQVAAADVERARSILAEGIAEAQDQETADSVESLAERAFRVAAVGVFVAPLQFYSLWLLAPLRWGVGRQDVSASARRRMVQASILDLWIVAWIAFLFVIVRST